MNNRYDQNVDFLLERLAQMERRLNQLEVLFNNCNDRDTLSSSHFDGLDKSNSWHPSPTTSSTISRSWPTSDLTGACTGCDNRFSSTINQSQYFDYQTKSQYLGKTPLACEEQRLPLPDILGQHHPSQGSDIPPAKLDFFEHVVVL